MRIKQRVNLAAAAAVGLLMTAAAAQPALASCDNPPPLGQPDAITYVVPDVQAARQQLGQGTGAIFTQTRRTVDVRVTGSIGRQRLTLTEAVYAPAEGPKINLVEVATGRFGTWGGDGRAHVALSYDVDSVGRYTRVLEGAGLRQLASGGGMAVWQGSGGVTIRLDEHLPSTTVTSSSTGFGAPVSIALYPCDPAALEQQLTQALGLTWREPQSYQLPWTLADGSSVSPFSTSTTSQNGQPYVTIANANSHGFPGEDTCAADYLPSYLIYATPDVTAADARLDAAGLQFIGAVPTMITLYISAGRVPVQVVHTSFVPQ